MLLAAPLRSSVLIVAMACAWGASTAWSLPAPDRVHSRWPAIVRLDPEHPLERLVEQGFSLDREGLDSFEAYVNQNDFDRLVAEGWSLEWVPDSQLSYWKEGRAKSLSGLSTPLEFYPTYDEMVADLILLEASYPDLCRLESIGQSHLGRELYFLKISDNPDQEEAEPEFKYLSTMHGDEPLGTVLCLNLIHHLLENYGADSRATALVDNTEIWILPIMNPDGYSKNPRTRGNHFGIDLNRAFPDPSTSPNNTPAGRPAEVGAVMNFGFAHSTVFSANFHTGEIVMNFPFDHRTQASPDEDVFVHVSRTYADANPPMFANDTPPFSNGIVRGALWYLITGGMQDWNYLYLGCNEITIELNKTKTPAESQLLAQWGNNQESMLAYLEKVHIGVRGVVTDRTNGKPIAATVQVTGRDHETYNDPQVGDYYRMLMPGTYELTFSASGYEDRIETGIVIEEESPTVLSVELSPVAPTPTPVPNSSFILLR